MGEGEECNRTMCYALEDGDVKVVGERDVAGHTSDLLRRGAVRYQHGGNLPKVHALFISVAWILLLLPFQDCVVSLGGRQDEER